jgi:hypothetical protein
MSLTKKIKDFYNDSKDFIIRNKNTLALAGTLAFSPLTAEKAEAQTRSEIRSIQREFFAQPEAEQLLKVHDWYQKLSNEGKVEYKDSLDIVVFGNNRLYHTSGGNVRTSPNSGVGATKMISNPRARINNEPFTTINMTGKSGGDFLNEIQGIPDHYVTIPSLINATNMNLQDAQKMVANYSGASFDQIVFFRGDEGQVVNAVYTGPSTRHVGGRNVMTKRRLADGNLVDHLLFVPGTDMDMHLKYALILGGFDMDLARSITSSHPSRADQLEALNIMTQLYQEAEQDALELYEQNKKLTSKADSLSEKNNSLANFLSKIEGGPGLFISNNKELAYALHLSRGVGKNNRALSLVGAFNPGSKQENVYDPVTNMDIQFVPGFNVNAVTVDSLYKSDMRSNHGASVAFGLELFKNLSLLAGFEYSRNSGNNVSTLVNNTYFMGADNVPFNRESWRDTKIEEFDDKRFDPLIGLKYSIDRANAFILYNPNKKEFQFGVGLDLFYQKK